MESIMKRLLAGQLAKRKPVALKARRIRQWNNMT